MKFLIGCECSGIVRDALISRGHDAWSCDLKPCERPGNHLQRNLLDVLDWGWDVLIAHPDCTYLTCSAEWAYKEPDYARYPGVGYHMRLNPETLTGAARCDARRKAVSFVKTLYGCCIPKVGIENPTGHLSSAWRSADQTIQPYEFGDDASKATGIWLKNLPILKPTKYIEPRIVQAGPHAGKKRWGNQTDGGQNKFPPSPTRAADRARTYQGIADAMASQWGDLLEVGEVA